MQRKLYKIVNLSWMKEKGSLTSLSNTSLTLSSQFPQDVYQSLLINERPNFAKILQNFVKYKYSSDKIGDVKKKSMKKLSKIFLHSADSLELPAPVSVYLIASGENKAVQCDPLYHVYYSLWEKYCKPNLPQTFSKLKKSKKKKERLIDYEDEIDDLEEMEEDLELDDGGDDSKEQTELEILENFTNNKQKLKLSNLFGYSMIRLILPMIYENIDRNYKMTKDMDSFAPTFYKDLTKEFNDFLSIIFHVQFDKLIEETQKIEKELDKQQQEKDEQLEKYNAYKPEFLPFKRSFSYSFFDFSTQAQKKQKICTENNKNNNKNNHLNNQLNNHSNNHSNNHLNHEKQSNKTISQSKPKIESIKISKDKNNNNNKDFDDFDDEEEDDDDKMEHVIVKPAEGNHVAIGPEGGMEVISGGGRRDQNAKLEEEKGILTSSIYTNDDQKESLYHLILIRNIFSRQLPKMPKDYITRLVVDRNHRTLVIKKLQSVVGGICFRPFENGFIEIAFCAVTADEQVKGYGTHLMNHLKNAMQKERIFYFLTYADNNAIGYFKKQGFTKNVSLAREKWAGFIKDYDGGTLMECRINETLDYLHLPTVIRQQREAIYERIKKNSNSHIVYPGITFFKSNSNQNQNTKIHVQHYNRNVLRKFKRIPLDQIKGIKESRFWKQQSQQQDTAQQDEINQKELNQFCKDSLKWIKNHPDAWPFFEPVNYDEVPDYYDVIADPIDLQVIEKRAESGQYYITREVFYADLKRMFENCRTYNKEDTIFFKCADNLERFFCDKTGAHDYFQN